MSYNTIIGKIQNGTLLNAAELKELLTYRRRPTSGGPTCQCRPQGCTEAAIAAAIQQGLQTSPRNQVALWDQALKIIDATFQYGEYQRLIEECVAWYYTIGGNNHLSPNGMYILAKSVYILEMKYRHKSHFLMGFSGPVRHAGTLGAAQTLSRSRFHADVGQWDDIVNHLCKMALQAPAKPCHKAWFGCIQLLIHLDGDVLKASRIQMLNEIWHKSPTLGGITIRQMMQIFKALGMDNFKRHRQPVLRGARPLQPLQQLAGSGKSYRLSSVIQVDLPSINDDY